MELRQVVRNADEVLVEVVKDWCLDGLGVQVGGEVAKPQVVRESGGVLSHVAHRPDRRR